jgi:hypothetical protein
MPIAYRLIGCFVRYFRRADYSSSVNTQLFKIKISFDFFFRKMKLSFRIHVRPTSLSPVSTSTHIEMEMACPTLSLTLIG